MIDRAARNKFAELLRSLASGSITNDDFEFEIPASDDQAIEEIFLNGGWLLYSDSREYKLRDRHALEDTTRSEVARWVLFLKSDTEYQWPARDWPWQLLVQTISFGLLGRSATKKWMAAGDVENWPFISAEQFERAKQGHGYLGGTKNTAVN